MYVAYEVSPGGNTVGISTRRAFVKACGGCNSSRPSRKDASCAAPRIRDVRTTVRLRIALTALLVVLNFI